MVVITKKVVEMNDNNFIKIRKKVRGILLNIKNLLAWTMNTSKNIGHYIFYQKTEPNNETAKRTLIDHRTKVDMTLTQSHGPRIVR